jgi:hypothetical protein
LHLQQAEILVRRLVFRFRLLLRNVTFGLISPKSCRCSSATDVQTLISGLRTGSFIDKAKSLQLSFLLLQIFHPIIVLLILLTRFLSHSKPGFRRWFQVGFRFLHLRFDHLLFLFVEPLLFFVEFSLLYAT